MTSSPWLRLVWCVFTTGTDNFTIAYLIETEDIIAGLKPSSLLSSEFKSQYSESTPLMISQLQFLRFNPLALSSNRNPISRQTSLLHLRHSKEHFRCQGSLSNHFLRHQYIHVSTPYTFINSKYSIPNTLILISYLHRKGQIPCLYFDTAPDAYSSYSNATYT